MRKHNICKAMYLTAQGAVLECDRQEYNFQGYFLFTCFVFCLFCFFLVMFCYVICNLLDLWRHSYFSLSPLGCFTACCSSCFSKAYTLMLEGKIWPLTTWVTSFHCTPVVYREEENWNVKREKAIPHLPVSTKSYIQFHLNLIMRT